jgi:hypothetical protein
MFYAGLGIGLVIGCFLGLIIAGLCSAAQEADRCLDEIERRQKMREAMGVEITETKVFTADAEGHHHIKIP